MSVPALHDRFVLQNEDGLFVADNPHPDPGTSNYGWRRFVWVRKAGHARQFFSVPDAIAFRADNLRGEWCIKPTKTAETAQPVVAT